jgi:hypothetical protein
MVELLEVTTVFLVMLLALAAASALHWLLLHAAFRLMQPATDRRNFPRNQVLDATPTTVRLSGANRL